MIPRWQQHDQRAAFDPGRTIVWLASYPKSGNTWLRALLTALIEAPQALDLDYLLGTPDAYDRHALDDHAGIDSSEFSLAELRPYLAGFVRELAADARPPRFIKTHSGYGDGTLFPADASAGAICVVRHPQDVAPSLAHHENSTLDAAIARMADPAALIDHTPGRGSSVVAQELGSWSGNVAGWLEQQEIPLLLVRYEDLLDDAVCQLGRIAAFLGLGTTPALLQAAVDACAIERLREAERRSGFAEAPRADRSFFRHGRTGSGKAALTPAQRQSISRTHGSLARQLGYDPDHDTMSDGAD